MLRVGEFALLAIRLLLAFIFLLAGAIKLVNPVGFRKGLRDFGLPSAVSATAVILLPFFELAVAIALIPASLAWYGACGALALLSLFLIVVAITMIRGRRPDCNCFGQLHSARVDRGLLIRDGVLALGAAWLVLRGRFHSGPDIWNWFVTLDGTERKIAILSACAVSFVFLRQLGQARPVAEPIESAPPVEEEEELTAPQPAPVRRTAPRPRPAPPPQHREPIKPGPQGIGLPLGTLAPDFELPDLTGARRSLRSLLRPGRDLLLIFSSPYCESCHAAAPNLSRWAQDAQDVLDFAVISRGNVKENLAKLNAFEAPRVLLQRAFEVSEAYDCSATPTAVLIDAEGRVRSELSTGAPAIRKIIQAAKERASSGLVNSERASQSAPEAP